MPGFERNLETVLAGITGAGDGARQTADRGVDRAHERDAVDAGDEPRQHRSSQRPLQRQEGAVGEHLDVDQMLEPGAQMGDVGDLAGGVDDEGESIAGAGHHQIVDDAAVVVEQQRVAHAVRRQRRDIARDQRFQRARRGGAGEAELAHVRDVEEPGPRPRVQVLGDDAGLVLHRHLVAGERHHPRAVRDMEIVKRRAQQRRGIETSGHQAHLQTGGREMRPGDAPSVVDPERFTACQRPGLGGLLLR